MIREDALFVLILTQENCWHTAIDSVTPNPKQPPQQDQKASLAQSSALSVKAGETLTEPQHGKSAVRRCLEADRAGNVLWRKGIR
jgi:hypothetical protein